VHVFVVLHVTGHRIHGIDYRQYILAVEFLPGEQVRPVLGLYVKLLHCVHREHVARGEDGHDVPVWKHGGIMHLQTWWLCNRKKRLRVVVELLVRDWAHVLARRVLVEFQVR
jgi:hypothetical protein